MRLTYNTTVQKGFQFKIRFLTCCYSVSYRGILYSFVVPMLYPFKVKSPYITNIQASIFLTGDPAGARTISA